MVQQDNICRSCVDCGVKKCHFGDGAYPDFCLTASIDESEKAEILKVYEDPEIHNIMIQAANVEYEGYCRLTRVEETIEFARKMGFHKIGHRLLCGTAAGKQYSGACPACPWV